MIHTFMDHTKGVYELLKESNLIKQEKYINKPTRCREKVSGWMWSGKLEVITIDDVVLSFNFWVNFHDDDGKDWYPNQKSLDEAWRVRYVSKERVKDSTQGDATWHLIYVDNHVYVSKTGFFHEERFDFANFKSINNKRDRVEVSIKNGTWEQDDDIWKLI